MKIEFYNSDEGYKEVIQLLNANHPEYDITVKSDSDFNKTSPGLITAKIGNKFYTASSPKELYDKITDHFFTLPNCFIG